MEWFFAIIIVLGIFTLFGWKGIYAVARLLGFIGAAIIVFVGGISYPLIREKAKRGINKKISIDQNIA